MMVIQRRRRRRRMIKRNDITPSPEPSPESSSSSSSKTIPPKNNCPDQGSVNGGQETRQFFHGCQTPPTSYINVAPLPIFTGADGECPATHLSRFAKVARANNAASVETMMRIFPVTLENEAALWYDLNIEPYPSLNWEEIKSSFLEAYHRPDFESQLMGLHQGDGESVRSYFLRLQWILTQWPGGHGLPDHLVKGVFIDGLRGEFRDWIGPQEPDSLEEALRLAFVWERVRRVRMDFQPGLKCGFCDGMHEERDCEIRTRMRDLWLKKKKVDEFTEANTESVDGDEEEEEEKKKKKMECQCSKHKCWEKKQLGRNFSVPTVRSGNMY